MRSLEDARIVALYWERSETAIDETARKYGPRLRQIGRNVLEDESAAEECENDTYLQAWNSIPPHRPVDYLFAFLGRIMRHTALSLCRKRARLKRSAALTALTEEMEQCIPAPDDTPCRVDGILLGEAISRFLDALPPERRHVFVGRYWYLDPIARIAQSCGFTESKTKSMLFRTRNELRVYLEKEGYTL